MLNPEPWRHEMRPLESLFVIALILYTFVIWSHKIKKELKVWMIWLFGLGLAADINGTIFLCVMSTSGWNLTTHTVSGFASLLIMALHFAWASLSLTFKGNFELYFERFSVYAWLLWLVAFISGIPG